MDVELEKIKKLLEAKVSNCKSEARENEFLEKRKVLYTKATAYQDVLDEITIMEAKNG